NLRLKLLSKEEIERIIPLFDAKEIKKDEPIFIITKKHENVNNDPLVNLEVSFRKCERLGVFEK
ncbi:hypothetical protein HY491_04705, partial [Candidatus Woesearchaeota archaeon]|nr:hypothetical protein [Candidatus Woesearchaeota archaeon]